MSRSRESAHRLDRGPATAEVRVGVAGAGVHVELGGGAEGPGRLAERDPADGDEVRVALVEDRLRLERVGDAADRADADAGGSNG